MKGRRDGRKIGESGKWKVQRNSVGEGERGRMGEKSERRMQNALRQAQDRQNAGGNPGPRA